MTKSTPKDQLRRMLEQTLVPPTTVTELDPTTVESATSRWGSVEGNLGESYHLNSMLTPTIARRLADQEASQEIAEFYFTTTSDAYDQLLQSGSRWVRPLAALPPGLGRLIGGAAQNPAFASAMFSADLLVIDDGQLWRLVPGRPGLLYEGEFTGEHTAAMSSSFVQQPAAEFEPRIVLVGHLARASYLTGDRCYRNAALSGGLLLGGLWQSAFATGTQMITTYQFLDQLINPAARCDGIERGVLAVCLFNAERLAAVQSE